MKCEHKKQLEQNIDIYEENGIIYCSICGEQIGECL